MSARLCLLLFVGTCAAQPVDTFQFGVCTHLALQRQDAGQVLSLVDAGGFNSIRDDAFWGAIESDRNVLRLPPKYAELRKAFAGSAARGHNPLVILAYGNRHYDGGGLVRSRAAIDAYARYAGFVASELRPHVRQFEIWNEWNSGFGSKPRVTRAAASDYVRVLASASAAVRAAHPQAVVIGGVTSGVDLAWYRELIDAGGLAHLDAVSVHSYTLFRREVNPEGAIASIDKLHQLLVEAEPERDIPVYVTEVGWPTNHGKHGVSERDAAMYLVRFMLLARTRPWIGGVWWYDLVDDGESDSSAEHRFGLVRRDLSPKPAFGVAMSVMKLLDSGEPLRAYRYPGGGYLVTGRDERGPWAMGWSMSPRSLAWTGGSTPEPDVPAQYGAIEPTLPADGYPVLFRKQQGTWTADAQWLERSGAGPRTPAIRVSGRKAT
jgi:hypothetical protein